MKKESFRGECTDLLPEIVAKLGVVEASLSQLRTGRVMASLCDKVAGLESRLDRMETKLKHEDTPEGDQKRVLEVYATRLRNKRYAANALFCYLFPALSRCRVVSA